MRVTITVPEPDALVDEPLSTARAVAIAERVRDAVIEQREQLHVAPIEGAGGHVRIISSPPLVADYRSTCSCGDPDSIGTHTFESCHWMDV